MALIVAAICVAVPGAPTLGARNNDLQTARKILKKHVAIDGGLLDVRLRCARPEEA
ncbi:MAG: hypothetical protein JO283_11435 [Bradyrhizobium sp.]|nr:hypothetical protein [Bradyrhizobium sp.]